MSGYLFCVLNYRKGKLKRDNSMNIEIDQILVN